MEGHYFHECSATHLHLGGNHQVHAHQRLGVGGMSEWVSEISSLVLKLLFHEALGIPSFIHEEKTRK